VFEIAKLFAKAVVALWRPKQKGVEIVIVPVSIQDETTKLGAMVIIIGFMEKHSLIKWDKERDMYVHGDAWKKKWLFIVGDGLSLERMFQFFDDVMSAVDGRQSLLDGKKWSFRKAFQQSLVFNDVIERVVPINGDLHSRFHTLDTLYRLFYGGFLQPIQQHLPWKKICGTDVTKLYEQCHLLIMTVYEECRTNTRYDWRGTLHAYGRGVSQISRARDVHK
jgi:hypothetical protein